jgi:hypothetical protein
MQQMQKKLSKYCAHAEHQGDSTLAKSSPKLADVESQGKDSDWSKCGNKSFQFQILSWLMSLQCKRKNCI